MKRIIYLILLALCTVLDIYILLETFYHGNFQEREFWFLHIVITLIFYGLNTYVTKEDISYFDVMTLLFPVVGYGGLLFIELIPKRDSHYYEIEENIDLKHYIKKSQEDEYIDLEAELGLIGAYDSLLADTPREKKKFLMGFHTPEVDVKVDVLKKALLDEDIEVIHYAAVELNKIEERYQEKMKKVRKEGSSEELLMVYLEYIDSGLPEGDILTYYRREALRLIEVLDDDKWKLEEVRILEALREWEICEKKLRVLLEGDTTPEVVRFATRYYYERNDYESVLKLKLHEEEGVKIPFHLRKHTEIRGEELYG